MAQVEYSTNMSLHHKSQSFNPKANANAAAGDDNTGMECPKILNTNWVSNNDTQLQDSKTHIIGYCKTVLMFKRKEKRKKRKGGLH
jgi:hypothetical protein